MGESVMLETGDSAESIVQTGGMENRVQADNVKCGMQEEVQKDCAESKSKEGGESLLTQIKAAFDCGKTDVRAYSPLTLAYIGDAVYDLVIRTVVVERANRAANELHKRTVKYVNAGVQAAMIEVLTDELTEEELAVYKRGRNAKSHTSAKNASIQDYRKATGFEALVGYLYLTDQTRRLLYLVKTGIERLG